MVQYCHSPQVVVCHVSLFSRYDRYGCSKEAVHEALAVVDDMTDAYRLAHGIRDFL